MTINIDIPVKYGSVYFAWAENTNRYKIGFAEKSAENRVKNLSGSQAPFKIHLILEIIAPNPQQARKIENWLHSQFRKYECFDCDGDEWFEFSLSQARVAYEVIYSLVDHDEIEVIVDRYEFFLDEKFLTHKREFEVKHKQLSSQKINDKYWVFIDEYPDWEIFRLATGSLDFCLDLAQFFWKIRRRKVKQLCLRKCCYFEDTNSLICWSYEISQRIKSYCEGDNKGNFSSHEIREILLGRSDYTYPALWEVAQSGRKLTRLVHHVNFIEPYDD